MGFLIGLLTVIMVLDCLVLMFLVLIQLPKKEAGAGLAFGGAATDALFGAGSGNVLTKITKYVATAFFVLAIVLSLMQNSYHNRLATDFQQNLSKPLPPPATSSTRQPAPTTPAEATPPQTGLKAPSSNDFPLAIPTPTNVPAASNPSGSTNK